MGFECQVDTTRLHLCLTIYYPLSSSGPFLPVRRKQRVRHSKSFAAISTLLQVGLICIQGSDSILIVRLSYSPRLQDHDSILAVVQQRHQIIRWLNTRARCLFSYIEEALEEDV